MSAKQAEVDFRLAELTKIGKGTLTAEAVVWDAKKKSSVLHKYFEWDDTKAGHAWRMEQARTLIRSVKVIITTEKSTISAVAYVRDPDLPAGEPGYVSLIKVSTDKDRARAVLVDEFTRAAAALRRAHEMASAFGMEEGVANVLSGVNNLQIKVAENRAMM